MNLKLIVGICIILACGSVGFNIAADYRNTVRQLRELSAALSEMICELQYRATPLPQLCRQISNRTHGVLGQIFALLAAELEMQGSSDVSQCMNHVLDKFSGLNHLVLDTLDEMGRNLGKFDINGQVLVLEGTKRICSGKLEALMMNKDRKLRSYQTLGLCAGAALAILFV